MVARRVSCLHRSAHLLSAASATGGGVAAPNELLARAEAPFPRNGEPAPRRAEICAARQMQVCAEHCAWLHLVFSTSTLVGDEVGCWFALPARLRRRLGFGSELPVATACWARRKRQTLVPEIDKDELEPARDG